LNILYNFIKGVTNFLADKQFFEQKTKSRFSKKRDSIGKYGAGDRGRTGTGELIPRDFKSYILCRT